MKAVQAKELTKGINDVALGLHEKVELAGETVRDYLGLYVNDFEDMHVFRVRSDGQVDAPAEDSGEEDDEASNEELQRVKLNKKH